LKPGRAVIPATDHRFEGDLKEKGLKRHPCGPSGLPPGRFEGDLKEKGLKHVPPVEPHDDVVLKET